MIKTLSILLLLLFSAPLVFAGDFDLYQKFGQKSAKWDSLVKAGFESFDGGNLTAGLTFMQKAYNFGCRDGLLLFRLSLIYESKRQFKDAQKFLDDAAPQLEKQYPDYRETKNIHAHLGRLYYQTDQYDKALVEIEKALVAAPDDFVLLFISAQIYRVQKKYPEAIANFEKALAAKAPPDVNAAKSIKTELMALYFEMGDYQNSLKHAVEMLALFPNDQTALSYKQRIQTELYKQREKEAIKKIVE